MTWLPSWFGSHKIRVGTQLSWGNLDDVRSSRTDFLARYRSGVPDSVRRLQHADHDGDPARRPRLVVQDSWTLGSRLTLNAGVRWQLFRGTIPAQTSAAGRFVSERSFAKLDNIPNWKDYTPRLAIAYDIFGTGRTALKANVSKYVSRHLSGLDRELVQSAALTERDPHVD